MSKLTVKWQRTYDGMSVEHVLSADEVLAVFPNTPDGSWPEEKAVRAGYNFHQAGIQVKNGLDERLLREGKVYVMNEAGRTVASYDFGYGKDHQPD